MRVPIFMLATDASGSAEGGRMGQVVMVVDVIDMSTTLEAALDAGALAVFGASPDGAEPPVPVSPDLIGLMAATEANRYGTDVVVVAEPRVGTDAERRRSAAKLLEGISRAGGRVGEIIPNLGAETPRLVDFSGRVVVAVTGSGGVAFDAAVTAGAPAVITGTIARTGSKKGTAPARDAALRALKLAEEFRTGITVVAASRNSLEDLLAAEYILRLILEESGRRSARCHKSSPPS